MPAEAAARILSFYLPQYHPIPENDEAWGPGFTEWTNVVRAKPLFGGHYQPHLPGELGYYDLRVAETRERQAQLAREHGIDGFVYYHYWFQGRRLLGRPFDDVLASGRPDFPFALCWANENWTRAWDGGMQQVIVGQEHTPEDDVAHLRWLATAFADDRYIRVDGRPMLLVYRASRLPDAAATIRRWRDEARALGVGELYLVRVQSFDDERSHPAELGFDAAVDWVPDWNGLGRARRRARPWWWARRLRVSNPTFGLNKVYDYADVAERSAAAAKDVDYPLFPCVLPGWDNSARRRRDAVILHGATPQLYERWLERAIRRAQATLAGDERIVFVNAWNEWAEGNHLEPDARWGRDFLEATRRAVTRTDIRGRWSFHAR